jgi:WD40 repeat protein/serine/threonine protein kinase
MMMTEEQLQLAKEIYQTAAERERAEWPSLLDDACRDDAELRAEVEDLLSYLPGSENFIEQPPLGDLSLAGSIAQTLAAGRRIGPYEVLEEIGRGGMGAVYLAVRADDEFDKQVAIKLVWPGFDSAEIIKRFRQERQILANLDHPNIARLLDGGTTEEGWPYLVMEYVDGVPITEYCDERQLSVAERLKLFQQVCAAVQYAHRNLVVHRDLKPGNIFVTRDGAVKLLDFGIAKILDPSLRPDALSLTHTGMYAMTPEYASPEQARGENITTASDVYSLGVTLYELLTGVHPFRFKTRALHEMLRTICEDEPARPSLVCSTAFRRKDTELPPEGGTTNFLSAHEDTPDKLRRRLRGDLDSIILKAMRKEPEQRYASVEQLSEDTGRHLAGQPVIARKGSTGYRARRFIRRHKAGVAATAALALALIAGMIVVLWQAGREREQARAERREFYAAQMPRAAEDWERGNIARMNETLAGFIPENSEEDLRGFEWHYLWRLSHRNLFTLRNAYPFVSIATVGEQELVTNSSNLPASSDRARAGFRHDIRVWDAQTGREIPALAFRVEDGQSDNPFPTENGYIIPIIYDYEIRFLDYRTKKELVSIRNQARIYRAESATSDGRILALGDEVGDVSLWDVFNNQRIRVLARHSAPILALSCINRMLGALSQDGELTLWDWQGGRLVRRLREPEMIKGFDLGHNARWLVTDSDKTVTVREVATGREVARLTGDTITHLSFTANGTRLFVARSDRTLKMHEIPSLRLLATFSGHTDWVRTANISPDGKMLLTGSLDRTLKLWDIATQRELAVIRGHTGDEVGGFFSADGRRLITYSNDYTARVWDLADALRPASLTGHKGNVYSVAFSPDGRALATAGGDGAVKLWEAATGRSLDTLVGHTGQVLCVAFSPDGRLLASSGENREAKVWQVSTGRELLNLSGHTYQIHSITFSPDGGKLATASDDNTVRVWDAATGQTLLVLRGHTANVWSVAFSPDGRQLASGSHDGLVRFWDATTGQPLDTLKAHEAAVWSLRFTPDGQRLLSASMDKTAKLWNLATKKEQVVFKGHQDEIFAAVLSPDGRRVATASNDKTIKLWDAATGRELLTLNDHTDQVWDVAFSPDGQTLASASWDGTARLWRAATEEEVRARSQR